MRCATICIIIFVTSHTLTLLPYLSQITSCVCVCVRVCNWPLVRGVCPNYEVVVLQTQTVTPLHLGSVAIVTLILALPSHLFLHFYGYLFCLLLPTSPPSVVFHCQSLILFALAPCLLSQREALPTWAVPEPDTRQPPPLVSAPRTACLHMLPSQY